MLVSKIDLRSSPPLQYEAALSCWRPNEPVVNGGVNEATGWVSFQCNIGRGDGPANECIDCRQASKFLSGVMPLTLRVNAFAKALRSLGGC